MIPNFIFEELGNLGEGEINVLLAIYRKTVGFGKEIDEIAYSQFVKMTKLSKSTISKAITSLERKKLIKVDRTGIANKYCYCLPKDDSDNKKAKSACSNIEQEGVQKSNNQPVRKSNTQKKTKKEKENTTTSSSDLSKDLLEVINYWNKTFPGTLDPSDKKTVKDISKALKAFSVKLIKKAIFIRSNYSWYRGKKRELMDTPSAFFPYHKTILKDSKRTPNCIFTYDEKNQRTWDSLNDQEDFEMLPNYKDEQGRPKWRLKPEFNLCGKT